ncbi:MAG: hypothetical protein ACI8RZ_007424 [Myxococcota bacterium]|jgi:hypothetical protein
MRMAHNHVRRNMDRTRVEGWVATPTTIHMPRQPRASLGGAVGIIEKCEMRPVGAVGGYCGCL